MKIRSQEVTHTKYATDRAPAQLLLVNSVNMCVVLTLRFVACQRTFRFRSPPQRVSAFDPAHWQPHHRTRSESWPPPPPPPQPPELALDHQLNTRPWQTEELENLTTCMEENYESLRGKPADWIDRVKEGISPDSEGWALNVS